MLQQVVYGVYMGSRGSDFKKLITSVLKRGNLKDKYIKLLTNKESLRLYSNAFTSELVDSENNYQVLEQLGDLTGNKFIVNYMYKRFPQLSCANGVKIVARLRINYGAKQSFSEIARKLGFWPFISATNDLRSKKMKPLLEDVFEAFIGVTEMLIDNHKRVGVGYAIVYDILSSIFDEMDISLRYEDLYDAKTRLKELFDLYEDRLGPLVYKDFREEAINHSIVYRVHGGKYEEKILKNGTVSVNKKRIIGGRYVKLGDGYASLKADSQQKAAENALSFLKNNGISKPVPDMYKNFNKKVKITEEIFSELYKDGVNELYNTKAKSKYQNKYQSTPLSLYCREKSIEGISLCLDKDVDINKQDTDGMYPIDLLFIGNPKEKTVITILSLFEKKLKGQEKINIHKDIYDMYINQYVDDYIKSFNKFNIKKIEQKE